MNVFSLSPLPYSSSTYCQWSQYYSQLNQPLLPTYSPAFQPFTPLPEYTSWLPEQHHNYWNAMPMGTLPMGPYPPAAATPLNYSSSPSLTPITPPTPSAVNSKPKKSLVCSHCQSTQSCQWRNVRKANVLCNACFMYERKYNKCRPLRVAVAFNNRKAEKKTNNTVTTSPY